VKAFAAGTSESPADTTDCEGFKFCVADASLRDERRESSFNRAINDDFH
jgi:hypothetical protein